MAERFSISRRALSGIAACNQSALDRTEDEKGALGTAAGTDRGHSCPQQHPNKNMALETAEIGERSKIAADRNVRAPAATSQCARMKMPRNFLIA